MIDGTRVLRLVAREGSVERVLQQVFDAGYSQGFEHGQGQVSHPRERTLEANEREALALGEDRVRELLTEPLRAAIRQAGVSGVDSW